MSDEDSNHAAQRDEFAESEDGELHRLEIGNGTKSSPNPSTIRAKVTLKVEGRVEPTKNVSAVDALVTSERIAEPRLTSMEDSRNLLSEEKTLEVATKKSQKHHKMGHWRPSIWGLLRCCQTTMTP